MCVFVARSKPQKDFKDRVSKKLRSGGSAQVAVDTQHLFEINSNSNPTWESEREREVALTCVDWAVWTGFKPTCGHRAVRRVCGFRTNLLLLQDHLLLQHLDGVELVVRLQLGEQHLQGEGLVC